MTDNNGTEKSRIIKTQDENGEMHVFELIDILELDDKEYGLLAYVGQDDEASSENEEDEEEEVVIMRLSKQDDSYTFETIEDDEEFNRVVSYLESETEDEEE